MEWSIASLPWNLLPLRNQKPKSQVDKDLDPELLRAIEGLVESESGQRTKRELGAGVAFLYLYMLIGGSDKNSLVQFTGAERCESMLT